MRVREGMEIAKVYCSTIAYTPLLCSASCSSDDKLSAILVTAKSCTSPATWYVSGHASDPYVMVCSRGEGVGEKAE